MLGKTQLFKATLVNFEGINMEEIFGLIALVTSMIGLLPQVYKAYLTKSTQDVSMLMLVNCLICAISWIGYGLYQHSMFVILSNIAGLLVSIILIIQKRYYDARNT